MTSIGRRDLFAGGAGFALAASTQAAAAAPAGIVPDISARAFGAIGDGGIRLGGSWNSASLTWLGDHCLWVDKQGRLRIKQGQPSADNDGRPV